MTGEGLPEPLVPAEVDLRGLEWMPFYGSRLLTSEFNARTVDDAAWRAAVNLWWSSWNEVPAGSLPDDEIRLCRMADLGRDLTRWREVRDAALHGFERCSDGRLYHRAIAPIAVEAWARRQADRDRKRAWKEARNRATVAGQSRDSRGTVTRINGSQAVDSAAMHNGGDSHATVTRRGNTSPEQSRDGQFSLGDGQLGKRDGQNALTGEDRTGQERTGQELIKNKSLGAPTDPDAQARGTRLPVDWIPGPDGVAFCRQERPDLDPDATLERFRDYWKSRPGAAGRKLDWLATWRNWVRKESGSLQR